MRRGPPLISAQWSDFFIHEIHQFEINFILDNDKITGDSAKTLPWITNGICDNEYKPNFDNAFEVFVPKV